MKYFLIIGFIMWGITATAQHPQVQFSNKSNISSIPKYNAQTGEKLSDMDFVNLLKENPGLVPRQEIDKYGKVSALYVDPAKTGRVSYRDESLRVKPGEDFLPFIMRTIDGEVLDSEKLKGKKVVLHAQLFLKPPMFVEKSLSELSDWVEYKQESEGVEFIVITESQKNDIDPSFLQKYSSVKIVADARNFAERYHITSYPVTIMINAKGQLMGYYDSFQMEQLKSDW